MSVETGARLVSEDHVVQFYGCEDELVAVAGTYLAAAVRDGDGVIVIATPAHRVAFAAAAADAGVDVAAARADGRLVVVDAGDVLAELMVDGWPDAARFEAVVGRLIRAAAGGGRRVRAYGEMVAVLWEAGNVTGAMAVERMWNQLARDMSFSLYCAYSADSMSVTDIEDALADVSDLHSHVVVGAPVPSGAEVTRRFAGAPEAAGMARRFAVETMRSWSREDLAEKAGAVVAELVINAVVHAGSDVAVGLSRHRRGVRVAVADASSALPVAASSSAGEDPQGGLGRVAAVATSWGHDVVDGGKVVWAELGAARRAPGRTFEISRRSLLLVLLEGGPRHGWGLAEDLAEATGERVDRSGVYRALHALENEGLVTSRWEKSQRSAPDQRSYMLTDPGRAGADDVRRHLEETIERLESLLAR